MNAPVKIHRPQFDLVGSEHWSEQMPYRAIVAVKFQPPSGPMLYQIAGSAANPCGAENALRTAIKIHGAQCYYCGATIGKQIASPEWTLDHVEPTALGGKNNLGNLVAACKPCNVAKGHKPIESFNPRATEEWLLGLAKQIEQRFDRLKATRPSSPPQP